MFPLVDSGWWRKLWYLKVRERFQVILWKLLWDVVPTKGRIAERVGVATVEVEMQCVFLWGCH